MATPGTNERSGMTTRSSAALAGQNNNSATSGIMPAPAASVAEEAANTTMSGAATSEGTATTGEPQMTRDNFFGDTGGAASSDVAEARIDNPGRVNTRARDAGRWQRMEERQARIAQLEAEAAAERLAFEADIAAEAIEAEQGAGSAAGHQQVAGGAGAGAAGHQQVAGGAVVHKQVAGGAGIIFISRRSLFLFMLLRFAVCCFFFSFILSCCG